jgi:hypothetical protein
MLQQHFPKGPFTLQRIWSGNKTIIRGPLCWALEMKTKYNDIIFLVRKSGTSGTPNCAPLLLCDQKPQPQVQRSTPQEFLSLLAFRIWWCFIPQKRAVLWSLDINFACSYISAQSGPAVPTCHFNGTWVSMSYFIASKRAWRTSVSTIFHHIQVGFWLSEDCLLFCPSGLLFLGHEEQYSNTGWCF